MDGDGARPGWYGDPLDSGRVRYWDGRSWTGHVTALEHPSALARLAPAAEGGPHADPPAEGEAGSPPGAGADDPDLTANRAGAEARRQADRLQRRRPIGSVVDRITGADTDERALRSVAEGKEAVGRRLARTGRGWHVLHAVPLATEDSVIDHLVIGPGGVYSLATRTHRDRAVVVSEQVVMVNGERTDYLPTVRFGARQAARLLSAATGRTVDVHPVLVVVAARLAVSGRPGEVEVVRPTELPGWLRRRPAELTEEAVDILFAQARRRATWTTPILPLPGRS